MTVDVRLPEVEEEEIRKPTSQWRLDYFKEQKYYILYDEKGIPTRTIYGQDARTIRQILEAKRPDISDETIRAFRPLIAEAFSREFSLWEEDTVFIDELIADQPRIHDRETPEEVYKRFWTGNLMRNGISADEVADRIIKSEPRVQIALVWGEASKLTLQQMTEKLAGVIKEYNPSGKFGS